MEEKKETEEKSQDKLKSIQEILDNCKNKSDEFAITKIRNILNKNKGCD